LKKIAIILLLLAILLGITANLSQLSAGWKDIGFGDNEPVVKAVHSAVDPIDADSQRPEHELSRTQLSILLGVGLVGLISFSRRKSTIKPHK
jgi:hypothetical protein